MRYSKIDEMSMRDKFDNDQSSMSNFHSSIKNESIDMARNDHGDRKKRMQTQTDLHGYDEKGAGFIAITVEDDDELSAYRKKSNMNISTDLYEPGVSQNNNILASGFDVNTDNIQDNVSVTSKNDRPQSKMEKQIARMSRKELIKKQQ